VRLLAIILGMSVVTNLPRVLPMTLLGRVRLPAPLERWLAHVPYAVLGALIFPGILGVQPAHPAVGLSGGAAAAVLALVRAPVLVVIAAAIAAAMGMQLWLGG